MIVCATTRHAGHKGATRPGLRTVGVTRADQARHQSRGDLILGDGEQAMIPPIAIHLQIALQQTLVPESELGQHPEAGRVLRPHSGFDPGRPTGPNAWSTARATAAVPTPPPAARDSTQ